MRATFVLLGLAYMGWAKTRLRSSDIKMVGGFIVKNITETPYVVSIQIKRDPAEDGWEPICAGSLLSALYVITACRCVAKINSMGGVESLAKNMSLGQWLFLAGAVDVTYPTWRHNPLAQNRTPEWIRHHPDCMLVDSKFFYTVMSMNDVAVAKMLTPFDLNMYIKPAELDSFHKNIFRARLLSHVGQQNRCMLSGWGSTVFRSAIDDFRFASTITDKIIGYEDRFSGTNDSMGNKLKKMIIDSLQDSDCCFNKIYMKLKKLFNGNSNVEWPDLERDLNNSLHGQICPWTKSAEGPCKGDSGSGIICDDRFIVGVTSWHIGCGDEIESVAQNLEATLDWLDQQCCTYLTCQDYLYRINACGVPYNDDFNNCAFPTTAAAATTMTTMTASAADVRPVTREKISSARTLDPNLLTMFLMAISYVMN